MAKETQYDKEIVELEKRVDQLQSQLYNLRQLQAEKLCPHKVGDIITNKRGDKKAQISRIKASCGNYTMFGYWLKKDGTPGTQVRQLYSFEWEVKE